MVKVSDPWAVGTLVAMAYSLLNAVFTNSREKLDGSLVEAVQVTVTSPPTVASVGALIVKAETKGRTATSALHEQGEGDDRRRKRRTPTRAGQTCLTRTETTTGKR